MKTISVSAITSLITTAIFLFIIHSNCDEGCNKDHHNYHSTEGHASCGHKGEGHSCDKSKCSHGSDGKSCAHSGKECSHGDSKKCKHSSGCNHESKCSHNKTCDHKGKSCGHHGEGHGDHAMMFEHLKEKRKAFDAELSADEKSQIAALKEKFADVDHENGCDKAAFKEKYSSEMEALAEIAANHQESLDKLVEEMHEHKEGHHGEMSEEEMKEHREMFNAHYLLLED